MRIRTAVIATAALAVVAMAVPAAAWASQPQHPATYRNSTSPQWLLVADTDARSVSVANATTGAVTGTLTGITFGAHAGTVQLGQGRVAFMDESKPQLDIVAISPTGTPRITAHYPIPSLVGAWTRAAWLATDPSRRYLAVGSDFDDSTTQQVTLIDQKTGRAQTAELPISEVNVSGGVGTEEMETFLVGNPLRLVITAGGHLDAYLVSPILAGNTHPTAFASAPLSAYPHGPIVNNAGTVIGSDVALGVQTTHITRDGFGASTFALYPKPSVQSYRPLMAPDGTTAVGTQAGLTPTGTSWDRIPAYLTTASTASPKVTSVPLGTGQFTRAAATINYAAAELTGASGDRVILVQRNPRTGYFNGPVTSFTLQPLANEPRPGQTTATGGVRFLTATPDGSHIFVTRGGEGTVTELDVRGTRVTGTRTITVPFSLSNGGYLTTIDPNTPPYDLSGR